MRYEGSAQLSEVPRALLLHAAGEVVCEQGYGRLTVTRLATRSGVSPSTFRELFDGPEDCFVQAFEEAVLNAEGIAKTAFCATQGEWRVKVRAALGAVLAFLDERPDLRALLISEPAKAGPRVAERYAQTVRRVGRVLHESAKGVTENGGWLPAAEGECTVQGVLSMLRDDRLASGRRGASRSRTHRAKFASQMSEGGRRDAPLIDVLLNVLMGAIVLRYEGAAVATRELAHTESEPSVAPERQSAPNEVLRSLNLRVTFRKLRVLEAIAQYPGAPSRKIAEHAGISDEGQASKLLRRMQEQGLVQEVSGNAGRQSGFAYAWRLSPVGEELLRTVAQTPSSKDRVRGDARREARR